MTWARLDDEFYDHPKVIRAGLEAIGLFTIGLSYAARKLTDGVLAHEVVAVIARVRRWKPLAETLVEVGLWQRHPDGYVIHDYLQFNPPAVRVKKQRQDAAERMRNARDSSRNVRANKYRTRDEHSEKFARSSASPVPVPVKTETDLANALALAPIFLAPSDPLFEPDTAERITARARKEQRACRLPAEFPLTEELRTLATHQGCLDPDVMHAAFCDYWRGTGRRMVDWLATYRRWARDGHCGNGVKRCACSKGRALVVAGSGRPGRMTVTEATQIALDRLAAKGEV